MFSYVSRKRRATDQSKSSENMNVGILWNASAKSAAWSVSPFRAKIRISTKARCNIVPKWRRWASLGIPIVESLELIFTFLLSVVSRSGFLRNASEDLRSLGQRRGPHMNELKPIEPSCLDHRLSAERGKLQ